MKEMWLAHVITSWIVQFKVIKEADIVIQMFFSKLLKFLEKSALAEWIFCSIMVTCKYENVCVKLKQIVFQVR